MTIKELIPLLEAMDRGEKTQHKDRGIWIDTSDDLPIDNILVMIAEGWHFRIKPAPKYFVPKMHAPFWFLQIDITRGVEACHTRRSGEDDDRYVYTSSTEQKAQACADELQKVLDKYREITNE